MRVLQPSATQPSSYRDHVPRKPYRAPRDWLPEDLRDRFGRQARLEWLAAETPLDLSLREAAKRHHDLARGIRTWRDSSGQSTNDLAAAAGISVGTVRRILNGTNHLDMPTLFALAAAVDADLTVSLKRRSPS